MSSRQHVTLPQWNHLLDTVDFLYNQHEHADALMNAIYSFEIDDWNILYQSLDDFKLKLRGVYIWWAQEMPGRSATANMSTAQDNNGTALQNSQNSSSIGM